MKLLQNNKEKYLLMLIMIFSLSYYLHAQDQDQDTVKVEYEWGRLESGGLIIKHNFYKSGVYVKLPEEVRWLLSTCMEFLGKDGWEYVQTVVYPGGEYVTYIKRVKKY